MKIFFFLSTLLFFHLALAKTKELMINSPAPTFKSKTHDGIDFDLNSRKGQWTVLYFYPKADTPGCTKQACAFRDSIKIIRDQGADVFGVSIDTVEDQAKFHKKYHLNFTLIADADGKVAGLYGTKMTDKNLSQRWTFIIDPTLNIRSIDRQVDPVKDADKVAAAITDLKNTH